MQNLSNDIWDIRRTAERIGVTVAALRKWIRECKSHPAYFRAGRLYRWRRSDVEAWINQKLVRPSDENARDEE